MVVVVAIGSVPSQHVPRHPLPVRRVRGLPGVAVIVLELDDERFRAAIGEASDGCLGEVLEAGPRGRSGRRITTPHTLW